MSANSEDSPSQLRSKLAQITEKAWSDPSFRDELANDGTRIAREFGLAPRPGVTVHFRIDTQDEKNFAIPMPPTPALNTSSQAQLRETLKSLARLHAEVTCTTQWVQRSEL